MNATAAAAPRRDVLGGLEVHRVPHLASAWLISLAAERDTWLARPRAGWEPHPPGLLALALPTRRSARALRGLLLGAVADWRQVREVEVGGRLRLAHPDAGGWARAAGLVRMADLVNHRRIHGLCLGCGLRAGACSQWEPKDGPRLTAGELAWVR